MTPDLQDRIINRLVETGVSNEPWALAIVAALDGEEQLTAFLDRATKVAPPASRTADAASKRVEPPGVYVSSITVEGFRGVGPPATLKLTPGPGLSLVVGLRSADQGFAAFAGTNTERSRERAKLMEQALQFHAKHKSADCPVCGTTPALSATWAAATRREIESLKKETADCESAEAAIKAAVRDAQRFVTAPPPLLAQAKDKGLSKLHDARRHWSAWAEGREIDSPSRLADHLESRVLELAEAVRALVEEASTERKRREDLWRPAAAAIAGWLPDARAAVAAKDQVAQLKAAENWWKEASAAVRDERFAPIADRAVAVWNQLRLQSDVEIGGIELEGNAQRRRVALQVTVDGSPAEALGVMSQGELHSLALSLFLPRATLPESPFDS